MTGTTRSSSGLDARRRRVLFRSWHRGMKETDLITGPFADAMIDRLSDAELDEYERLIEAPDPDLYRGVANGEPPPPEFQGPVFQQLYDFHHDGRDPR
jgi:antitoxin CptB